MNPWKVPHLFLVENLSKYPSKGNPNPKDVGLTTHKPYLMMLKLKPKG
jgi:hypothetical protein